MTSYTQIPRAVMWLVRGDLAQIGGDDGEPAFEFELDSFYISRGVVTNRQYEAFQPDHGRVETAPGDDDPVVDVSFREALAYCDWYSDISKKPFRLPTEAEWEFACRAGTTSPWFFGADAALGADLVWSRENSSGRCHPVDTPGINKWGLYGMLGNVWEWTSSLVRPYPIVSCDGRDDRGPTEPRVLRGGCYLDPLVEISAGRRRSADESHRSATVGFRIARTL